MLLILDRKEDPVTPLLTQWTYQAQLHELIGIEHNVVNLAKVNKQFLKEKIEQQKFVVGHQDAFYIENQFSNFGDLASNVKVAIDSIASSKNNQFKIENLEDMQRALDSLPELKQHSSNVQKHVTLTCEISRLVESRVISPFKLITEIDGHLPRRARHCFQREQVRALQRHPIVDQGPGHRGV